MKQKLFSASLILLLAFAVFVSAQTEDERFSSENMKLIGSNQEFSYLNYQININVQKGWNLLPGIAILDIKSNSDIKEDEIYNFIYNKRDNKYIQLDNQESFVTYMENLGVSQKSYPYFVGQSTWVYSKREGILIYDAIMFPKNPILTKGWNFVSVTPYLVFSTNDEEKFLGSCKDKITTIYGYKADEKKWVSLETHNLDSLMYGAGAIVKVSEDCKLGAPTGEFEGPPTIPN